MRLYMMMMMMMVMMISSPLYSQFAKGTSVYATFLQIQ
jgi:hypothetical protein